MRKLVSPCVDVVLVDEDFVSPRSFIDLLEENERLTARVAELEAELAKDVRAVFDSRGKSINLMRI